MQGLTPERISLPPRPDAPRSPKPPVRMFLGTEPAQHRAERAFIFSIHKYRDPGRAYEIHLMRSLVGYRRWFWTTDFTNYRFAIPHYAGGCGRAIYNDVDQVYVADPGERDAGDQDPDPLQCGNERPQAGPGRDHQR